MIAALARGRRHATRRRDRGPICALSGRAQGAARSAQPAEHSAQGDVSVFRPFECRRCVALASRWNRISVRWPGPKPRRGAGRHGSANGASDVIAAARRSSSIWQNTSTSRPKPPARPRSWRSWPGRSRAKSGNSPTPTLSIRARRKSSKRNVRRSRSFTSRSAATERSTAALKLAQK